MICLEPTDNTLQLGCLGNLNARVVFEGRSAHSARPWLGVNAIKLAFEGLQDVLELEPRDVQSTALLFREVLSVTQIHGGIATNVIPARVEATLNFRYAPDRTPTEAEARAARARRGDRRDHARTRRQRMSLSAPRWSTAARRRRSSRCSRSRPGRTSPTSPHAGSTRSTSARALPATPTRSTSWSRSWSSSGRLDACSGSSRRSGDAGAPLARARRARAVSVRAARRLAGRGTGARNRADRLRRRRSARADAGVHPRGAAARLRRGLVVPPRRRACRSCGTRSPAGSSAASASRSIPRRRSSRRSARRRRSSRSRRCARRREAARRRPGAGVSGLRARRALRGRAAS